MPAHANTNYGSSNVHNAVSTLAICGGNSLSWARCHCGATTSGGAPLANSPVSCPDWAYSNGSPNR